MLINTRVKGLDFNQNFISNTGMIGEILGRTVVKIKT